MAGWWHLGARIFAFNGAILFGIIVLMPLAFVASAETVTVGDYSVSFNYSKPHETLFLSAPGNDVPVGTIVKNLTKIGLMIKTFDGTFYIYPDMSKANISVAAFKKNPSETIVVNNESGLLITEGDTFLFFSISPRLSFIVGGTLPFYDRADFLRSLHIRPIKK